MSRSISCPVCDADLELAGDERRGEQIYCTYCGAPFTLVRLPESQEDTSFEVEEDF
ncbi:MAG TPA: lysine biosynthesis protein LysW [Myxococcota bacterium]|jgi:hypothetical protein|nr:lysine biosynthesis protein LysW [Myxococcota bacterium]